MRIDVLVVLGLNFEFCLVGENAGNNVYNITALQPYGVDISTS
jgi:hypothetical protein